VNLDAEKEGMKNNISGEVTKQKMLCNSLRHGKRNTRAYSGIKISPFYCLFNSSNKLQ